MSKRTQHRVSGWPTEKTSTYTPSTLSVGFHAVLGESNRSSGSGFSTPRGGVYTATDASAGGPKSGSHGLDTGSGELVNVVGNLSNSIAKARSDSFIMDDAVARVAITPVQV